MRRRREGGEGGRDFRARRLRVHGCSFVATRMRARATPSRWASNRFSRTPHALFANILVCLAHEGPEALPFLARISKQTLHHKSFDSCRDFATEDRKAYSHELILGPAVCVDVQSRNTADVRSSRGVNVRRQSQPHISSSTVTDQTGSTSPVSPDLDGLASA